MAGPGDERAVTQRRGQGGLRASHADRERVIELLKAAFVQDRLTKDELDMRVGRALAARTGAELVALTADIPAGAGPARSPIPARRRPLAKAAAWSGNCLAIAGAAVWAAFRRESLAGPMLLLALYAVLAALVIVGFGVATSRKQRRSHPDQSRRALTIQL